MQPFFKIIVLAARAVCKYFVCSGVNTSKYFTHLARRMVRPQKEKDDDVFGTVSAPPSAGTPHNNHMAPTAVHVRQGGGAGGRVVRG